MFKLSYFVVGSEMLSFQIKMSPTHVCHGKQSPKHMNYLGAAVKGLKHLAARTGHKESCQYLLEGYMWRCPSNSFDYTCNALTDHSQCSCEPLQKLKKVSKWRSMPTESISPAEIIVDEGAVIFGQPSNSVSKKRRASQINGPEEYPEPLTRPSSQPVPATLGPPQLSPDNLSKLAYLKYPLRRWQDRPRRPRETEPSLHGDLHSTLRRERYINRVLSHMSKSAGAEILTSRNMLPRMPRLRPIVYWGGNQRVMP